MFTLKIMEQVLLQCIPKNQITYITNIAVKVLKFCLDRIFCPIKQKDPFFQMDCTPEQCFRMY